MRHFRTPQFPVNKQNEREKCKHLNEANEAFPEPPEHITMPLQKGRIPTEKTYKVIVIFMMWNQVHIACQKKKHQSTKLFEKWENTDCMLTIIHQGRENSQLNWTALGNNEDIALLLRGPNSFLIHCGISTNRLCAWHLPLSFRRKRASQLDTGTQRQSANVTVL